MSNLDNLIILDKTYICKNKILNVIIYLIKYIIKKLIIIVSGNGPRKGTYREQS